MENKNKADWSLFENQEWLSSHDMDENMNIFNKNRLELFVSELRTEMSDSEIACDITNGSIIAPEWLRISESNDHIKIWDEKIGSRQMGFMTLSY